MVLIRYDLVYKLYYAYIAWSFAVTGGQGGAAAMALGGECSGSLVSATGSQVRWGPPWLMLVVDDRGYPPSRGSVDS